VVKVWVRLTDLDVACDTVCGVHWSGFDGVVVSGEVVALFTCDLGVAIYRNG
jgi:hypothetical protein